jgi:hypothetical protein
MYGQVLGASTVVGTGAILLPNTGGNVPLTVAAITTIVVGSAILLTSLVRIIAKKAFKA